MRKETATQATRQPSLKSPLAVSKAKGDMDDAALSQKATPPGGEPEGDGIACHILFLRGFSTV